MERISPTVRAEATAAPHRKDGRSLFTRRSFLVGVTGLLVLPSLPSLPAYASSPVHYGRGYTGGY